MTNTNRFTAESCHEIGFGWEIDAPESITEEEIEGIIDMLINNTDDPSQEELQIMLHDQYACESLADHNLSHERLDLYKQISISVECVHRSSFSQSIERQNA